MSSPARHSLWRILVFLLLLALIAGPMGGGPGLASPPRQDAAPAEVQETEPELFAAPGDHLVTALVMTPASPNILGINQTFGLDFNYSTNQAGGVYIFVRPMTNGSLTPGYSGHTSPLYPTSATGEGSGWFSFDSVPAGGVVVDEVRIRMTNATMTTVLFEAIIPVHLLFTDADAFITNLTMSPVSPNVRPFGQNINFDFTYINNTRSSLKIFLRPLTNGSLTPNYSAHPSPDYSAFFGWGSGTGYFTINSGQVVVDQVRVQIYNAAQTTLYFEAVLPVHYRFRSSTPTSVYNFNRSSANPNIFKYGVNYNVSFNYTNNSGGSALIFVRPFSGAGLSPGYSASGSPQYAIGSGQGSGSFTFNSGPVVVDRVRIQMWNLSLTTLLYETFLPVHLRWAGPGPAPGPDMSVTAMEVTQAVQDLNHSVDLVAGKRTYVRVHATSPTQVSDVYATLTGKRGTITLSPVLGPGNTGSAITVRTSPDRGQLNHSFWFELPAGWTNAGNLTLTARLDPNNAKNDLIQSNNVKTVTVNFKSTPPLRLRLVNVQYRVGTTNYLANNTHLDRLESWLRRAYPINQLVVTRETYIYPNAGLPNVDTLNTNLALKRLLRLLFSGENSRTLYYGIVDDGGGFMRGKANGIPGTVSSGPTGPTTTRFTWDTDGTYGDWYGGHEIAHTLNRGHANFCGADGGGSYPYASGNISPATTGSTALYGFDIETRTVYGPTSKDVMTYCSNLWVSDFTYEGIRSYIVGLGLMEEEQQVSAGSFLVVSGLAMTAYSTVDLGEVYMIFEETSLPLPTPGDWEIVLLNAGGSTLASYPFAPALLTDAEETPGMPAVIAEVVPWVVGTTKVDIRYQKITRASRSVSPNAPTVDLLTPAPGTSLPPGPFTVTWAGADLDGDSLTYSLLYSPNGFDWQALATGLTATSLELHTDQLPGGSATLRVIVTDGMLTGQDAHSGLSVPRHTPEADILLPNNGEVFQPTQTVSLLGSGYDMEDGSLPESAFSWSSHLFGPLGTGSSLTISDLTTGMHVITLTVTDSDGWSTSVDRTIIVTLDDRKIFIPILRK